MPISSSTSRSLRKLTRTAGARSRAAGRYNVTEPGRAEIAFVVIDAYQSLGLGTLLMRHLAALARSAGLKEVIADVLPENAAMRKVFSKFGFQTRRGLDPQVVHLVLTL